MLLISLPTKPTSVNFVAYTLMNGASISLASLLPISVFPEPVGPDISMFLGFTYLLRFYYRVFLLHLFLIAIATVFLAYY